MANVGIGDNSDGGVFQAWESRWWDLPILANNEMIKTLQFSRINHIERLDFWILQESLEKVRVQGRLKINFEMEIRLKLNWGT